MLACLLLAVFGPTLWRGPGLRVGLTNRSAKAIEVVRLAFPGGEVAIPRVEPGETVLRRIPVGWSGPYVLPVTLNFRQGVQEAEPLPVRLGTAWPFGREVSYLVHDDSTQRCVEARVAVVAETRFNRASCLRMLGQSPLEIGKAWNLSHWRRCHGVRRVVINRSSADLWLRDYVRDLGGYLVENIRDARAAYVLAYDIAQTFAELAMSRPPAPWRDHTIPFQGSGAALDMHTLVVERLGSEPIFPPPNSD